MKFLETHFGFGTKQAAQGAMILAVKEPKDYYDVRGISLIYTPEDYQDMDIIPSNQG